MLEFKAEIVLIGNAQNYVHVHVLCVYEHFCLIAVHEIPTLNVNATANSFTGVIYLLFDQYYLMGLALLKVPNISLHIKHRFLDKKLEKFYTVRIKEHCS